MGSILKHDTSILILQNLIAASQCLVKTVDVALMPEKDTTVIATNIITGIAALVSSITIMYNVQYNFLNSYIYYI